MLRQPFPLIWESFEAAYLAERKQNEDTPGGVPETGSIKAEAIDLTSWSQMSVAYAFNAMAGVYRMLLFAEEHKGDKAGGVERIGRANPQELLKFIAHALEVFSIMNGDVPITAQDDKRLAYFREVLDYLLEWEASDVILRQEFDADTSETKQKPSLPAREVMHDLRLLLNGILAIAAIWLPKDDKSEVDHKWAYLVPKGFQLIPRDYTQDVVEQFFAIVRSGGGNRSSARSGDVERGVLRNFICTLGQEKVVLHGTNTIPAALMKNTYDLDKFTNQPMDASPMIPEDKTASSKRKTRHAAGRIIGFTKSE
jgi:hypothetical protein